MRLHFCCQFHDHPCCSCCAAVDCLFYLLSTLGFLRRSKICSLCVIGTVICGALSSLLLLLMSCFEPVVDCSKAGEVILSTWVNEKPAVTALDWQIKVPSYCLEKALSKQRTAVSLILLHLPLLLWHPLRVRVHNCNPESCHNIQASHGHAFKLWKMGLFYTALLHFQLLLSPEPSNVRLIFGHLVLNHSALWKLCQVTVNAGICSPSCPNLSPMLPPILSIIIYL